MQKDVPHQFDASVLVDASTVSLLESLETSGQLAWLKAKPSIVIDHHQTTAGIDYATVIVNEVAVSTGEIIYAIAKELSWPLPLDAMRNITVSILSDSLGLTSEGTTVASIRIIADAVETGVSLAQLDLARKELMKKERELVHYKGMLLQRVEFHADGVIASVTIPWQEIEKYSHTYNPPMLIMEDLRMTMGVGVIIAFKTYSTGRVTAKIRCNNGYLIADKIAEHFGGGGHSYAAGFKVVKTDDFTKLKTEVLTYIAQLLRENDAQA